MERQGRSVPDAGLGDILYRHGWLVNSGQGHDFQKHDQPESGFGTLIKEMMGLRPTARVGKAGHAAGLDRG